MALKSPSERRGAMVRLVESKTVQRVTPPLRGTRGYQIFKLEARSTPELRPFDSIRPEIERAIRDERIDPETQKMLARLRTQAVIEWKDDSFKEMYEKQIAKQAASAATPSRSSPGRNRRTRCG